MIGPRSYKAYWVNRYPKNRDYYQSDLAPFENWERVSGHGALAGLVQGNDCSPHIQTDHKSLRSETWKFVMLVKTKWPTSASFVPKQY